MSGGSGAPGGSASGRQIAVHLNGAPTLLATDTTVADVVGLAGFAPEARGVAVALDGDVVPRADWTTTTVREGARLEVLTAVAGG